MTKVVPERVIPAHKIASCTHCPDFKFWGGHMGSDCLKTGHEIMLKAGEMFPSFCPLNDAEPSPNCGSTELVEGAVSNITCGRCGAEYVSGTMCPKCY